MVALWTKQLTPGPARPAKCWSSCILECSITQCPYLHKPQSLQSCGYPFSPLWMWILYQWHIKQLEKFHMGVLSSILDTWWQDLVSNLEVLDYTKSTSIESFIIRAKMWWMGHVIQWMTTVYLPNCCIMYWRLERDLDFIHTGFYKDVVKETNTTVTFS